MLLNIEQLINDKYISKRKHPSEDLYILNYTAKTQYEHRWNPTTTLCRGLIVDEDYQIKARCFPKFFNMEEVKKEVEQRKHLSYNINEKIDGSLGIIYFVNNKPFVATRGSFDSPQATRATQILYEKYNWAILNPQLTYLVEIIYPENRICVNYGDKEELVLLSIYNIKSGIELNNKEETAQIFSSAPKIDIDDFTKLKELNWANKEGFVVQFEDGFRFKIKFDDYLMLHKAKFSLSTKVIWESIKSGKLEELYSTVPDEFFGWMSGVSCRLLEEYARIQFDAIQTFQSIMNLPRKEFAKYALDHKFSGVLFRMLDNKDYKELIWKMIEPEYECPTQNIEDT